MADSYASHFELLMRQQALFMAVLITKFDNVDIPIHSENHLHVQVGNNCIVQSCTSHISTGCHSQLLTAHAL